MNWTPEQTEVMNFLMAQVDNPDGKNVVVSGSGGTGKTTIICELICRFLVMGKKVAVTAMTGKATAVLRNKVFAAIKEKGIVLTSDQLAIETVTKITKTSKVLDVDTNGETKYSNTWNSPELFQYDILFVDELSMVPHFISKWWQKTNCRVFGFGDECQLPEVVTSELQSELASFERDLHLPHGKYVSGYGIKALKGLAECQLHKVLRSDNECALLCHDLRDFSMTKASIIKVIKQYAEKYEHISYSTSMSDLVSDPDWQILCYTNKMCQEINNDLCIGGDRYPDPADKILLFDNLNPLGLYNGDTLSFADFLMRISGKNTEPLQKNSKKQISVCMKWRGRRPSPDGNDLERFFHSQMVRYYSQKESIDASRVFAIPNTLKESGFATGLIDEYLEIFESIKDQSKSNDATVASFLEYLGANDADMLKKVANTIPATPRLYFVKADYGYAITTHKSQGSEYKKVCYVLERFDKPLLYTGLSRAKEDLHIINLTSTK